MGLDFRTLNEEIKKGILKAIKTNQAEPYERSSGLSPQPREYRIPIFSY
jgi:hypothetical protein